MAGIKVLSGSDAGQIELNIDDNFFNITSLGELTLILNNIWNDLQGIPTFAADIITALNNYGFYGIAGTGVEYWPTDDPAVLGDRVLIFEGQEIEKALYPDLTSKIYCGDANQATAPAFYQTDGAGVRTVLPAVGTHIKLPDSRGLSLKHIGNAAISGRVKTGPASLGSVQEDGMQRVTGQLVSTNANNRGGFDTASGAFTLAAENLNNFSDGGTLGYKKTANYDSGNSPNARISEGGTTATSYTRDSTIGARFGIAY